MATRTRTRSKTTARRPARKRRRRFGAGVWLRLPVLEQRDFDLIGLALVALGVFMACVLYLGWSGGEVGVVLRHAFAYALGMLVYAVPVALVAGGAVVVVRPFLSAGRPFGTGALCLFAALTLALSAGTLGLGPSGARPDVWDASFVEARGGVVGEALYTVADRAVQEVGAHILAIFLFSAGLLLVTGATVAGVLHAVRAGVAGTGRRLRESTEELALTLGRRTMATDPDEPDELEDPEEQMAPPEPAEIGRASCRERV